MTRSSLAVPFLFLLSWLPASLLSCGAATGLSSEEPANLGGAAGASGSKGTAGGGSPPSPVPTCAAEGSPCTAKEACCGGVCEGQLCQSQCPVGLPPTVVAVINDDTDYARFAVDSTHVYIVTLTSLVKVPRGGGPVTTVVDYVSLLSDVKLDESFVYYNVDSQILRLPKAGGNPEVVLSSEFSTLSFTITGDELFVVLSAVEDDEKSQLWRVSLKTLQKQLLSSQIAPGVHSLTTSADTVFITSYPGGELERIGKDGSGLMLLAKGESQGSLTADDNAVYWSTGATTDNTLNQLSHGATSPSPVALHQKAITGLTHDATHVYWVSRLLEIDPKPAGFVHRWPKNGSPGQVESMAEFQSEPSWIEIDDTCIYWINGHSHELMRMAK